MVQKQTDVLEEGRERGKRGAREGRERADSLLVSVDIPRLMGSGGCRTGDQRGD